MKSKEKFNNIVVLNKLPSNMVKEAIIVLRREYNFENIQNKQMKENIVKEAEDVLLNYIKNNKKEKNKKEIQKIKQKYKIGKLINIFLILVIIVLVTILIYF